jgi:cystathionine beta-lyase/cystathionine gamma-synthase
MHTSSSRGAAQTHPQHDIAARQMNHGGNGYGGMMCVRLRVAQGAEALGVTRAFVAALRVVECTISLGGCHTTLCLPCETSHAALEEEDRSALGLGADCFRLAQRRWQCVGAELSRVQVERGHRGRG